jgi:hypothetical protein
MAGCLRPEAGRSAEVAGPSPRPADVEADAPDTGAAVVPESSPDPGISFPPVDDTERWLVVEEATSSTEGAWATGSFDAERNKLTIVTEHVRQFSIDTDRIPIDWDRLVVLRIDGSNSELRKRDYPVLHIARDAHGRWVVLDP